MVIFRPKKLVPFFTFGHFASFAGLKKPAE